MFDGQRIESVNFRSVYLTLALEEMTRIGVSLGARPETFAYLAGMGDLLATALSQHSHNRKLGVLLARRGPAAPSKPPPAQRLSSSPISSAKSAAAPT